MKTRTKTKNTEYIQVRIDSKTKKEAKKVLENIGMDTSTAVKILFKQIINTQSFPVDIGRTANGFTSQQEKEIIKETEWALKHGKRYSSIEEAHRDILK